MLHCILLQETRMVRLSEIMPYWYIIHHMQSLNQIYRGRSTLPDKSFVLHAGNLRLTFCNGGIRSVMAGDREIVRRVYVAVRDDIWNTIGFSLSNLRIDSTETSFRVDFDCLHKKGIVNFAWHGAISGTLESTIRFSMQGHARSSFHSNRIGFCVLHPLSECIGAPCTIMTAEGDRIRSHFPRFISAEQPFRNIRTIIQAKSGIESRITFKGDTFEMEDQRNWSDASFKTYCPPRSLPYPFVVKKGDRFSQSIEIAVLGTAGLSRKSHKASPLVASVDVHLEPAAIPQIGCALGMRQQTRAGLLLARLLNPSHVRIDITLSRSKVASALRRLRGISKSLAVPLELALHFSQGPLEKQLRLVDEMPGLGLAVKRILVFRHGEKVTSIETIREVAPVLRKTAPEVDIVTGTDSYFVEINRAAPDLRGLDGLCYSVNPQVHTFDDQSLVENIEGQFYTVQAARRLGHGAPVFVTPITLRPRLNPELPKKFHGADVRQRSLLGAVWTLGSIIGLAKAGATGATYFELAGPCGVMERDGSRVFPLFHVLADVNEFAGGTMRFLSCARRSGVVGCLLEKSGRRRWLIANTSLEAKTITVSGLSRDVYVKHLDETTFAEACDRPTAFRRRKGSRMRPAAGRLKLRVLPYGILRLDS
jgi:D-apionolactonase